MCWRTYRLTSKSCLLVQHHFLLLSSAAWKMDKGHSTLLPLLATSCCHLGQRWLLLGTPHDFSGTDECYGLRVVRMAVHYMKSSLCQNYITVHAGFVFFEPSFPWNFFPSLLYLLSLGSDRKVCTWMLKRYSFESESENGSVGFCMQPSWILSWTHSSVLKKFPHSFHYHL